MNDSRVRHGSRRQLFRSLIARGEVKRPPWTDENLTERCTRCEACIEICPEGVLYRGGGGFPEIRFDSTGCSLCGDCVDACDASVFDIRRPAFAWHAEVQANCLALAGIHCQSCQDACEWRAISFSPHVGRAPRPGIDTSVCIGCGACQARCPSDAIRMVNNHDSRHSSRSVAGSDCLDPREEVSNAQ